MAVTSSEQDLEALEIHLLLEGIFRHYGYDFRDYALVSLRRRVLKLVAEEQTGTISGLLDRLLHDRACWRRVLRGLSVIVTSMFRSPDFFRSFRDDVVPILRDLPFIRIWHAGCATGEEVYSLAILLEEEGLYDRCRVYATDINETLLKRARGGIYSERAIASYQENYQSGGGKRALMDHFNSRYGHAIVRSSLRERILFARHNLATDRAFNDFHVIICRNVLIYFNRDLQQRVHSLLFGSLISGGILGLGEKESVGFTPFEQHYTPVGSGGSLYRRLH